MADVRKFYFFAHNPNQMYLPNYQACNVSHLKY